MSILGVKKNNVEIKKIKNDHILLDTKNKYLYRRVNTLKLEVLNIENGLTTVKNKPDRKIISIFASSDSALKRDDYFYFGKGSIVYTMGVPGKIINMSLITQRSQYEGQVLEEEDDEEVTVYIEINGEKKKLRNKCG